jgi:solute carrier family 25 uncoupling protein 27
MPSATGGGDFGSGLAGIAKKFCLTGTSSMMAEGATFPVDITKTRLQLQGQADFTGTRLGFGGMAMDILKKEGIGGLYAGVTPAVARHIPYTGFRAIGYEYIRAFFCGSAPKDQAPLLAKMAAGMSAGAIGQAIAVPCDLIKVRMQSDGRLVAAGKLDAPRYTGLFDAFNKIKAAEGMGGFYQGCTPAIQRAALVNLGELTTYDSAKKSIVVYTGDNLLCHLCSAICSGFVASLCSTPADVAKSRIMSQSALPDGTMPYNGTLDCWRKVVANEGPLALYKGFMPGWLRLGPWQLVFWCSYEQLRILTGIGGFK